MKEQAPFKFLDAYNQADKSVFFGRDKEINDLYDALSGVKHLLVYGPSGAGKTSLIECGLRNQFSDADWFALSIRRGENINASVFAQVNEALEVKITLNSQTRMPEDVDKGFGELIEQLFEERFQPVYLLFDQFEELLILGSNSEKREFFIRLNQLIRYKVPCRIMLIMREEFIGHLSEFEVLCPTIFKQRFRLEKMRKEKVRTVIHEMLEAEEYKDFYTIKDSKALANSILAKLPDEKREIELTHVQVFLSELWDRAKKQTSGHHLPVLQPNLIKEEDDLEGVLNNFLKKQLQKLSLSYGENNALEVLAVMISERHTKLQLSAHSIQNDLQTNSVQLNQKIPDLLRSLEKCRLIRAQKAGIQTQYEISHDLLALAVGQNLTEEMQMRQKASEVYKVYIDRQGFLNQDDLDFMRPYLQYKACPSVLEEKIKESDFFLKEEQKRKLKEAQERVKQEKQLRDNAEKNAQRAKQRTIVASIITLFAIMTAISAYIFFVKAKDQAERAEKLTDETNQQKIEIQNVNQFLLIHQDSLQKETKRANKESQIAELEKFKVKKERDKVRLVLLNLRKATENNSSFLLKEAKLNILNFQYPEALQKLKVIQELGFLEKEGIESLMEIAYFYNESHSFEESIEVLNLIINQSLTKSLDKIPNDSLKQNQIKGLLFNLDSVCFSVLPQKTFSNLLRYLIAEDKTEEALKKLDFFLIKFLGDDIELYFMLLNFQWRNQINNENSLKDIITYEEFFVTRNQINDAFLELVKEVEFKIKNTSILTERDSSQIVINDDYELFLNFKKGEIEDALKNMHELLINNFWEKNLYIDLVILMNQYNRLEKFERIGVLRPEEIKIRRNLIGVHALELAEKILESVNKKDNYKIQKDASFSYLSIHENTFLRDSIVNFIIEDKLDRVFKILEEKILLLAAYPDLEIDLVILQSRYHRNEQSFWEGLVSLDELEVNNSKTNKALLDLIFELNFNLDERKK